MGCGTVRRQKKEAARDWAASRLLCMLTVSDYSSERISKILIAAVAIGVPGPKIAAAPSR